MSQPAVYCPTGCGSTSFGAVRRGAIREEFTINDYGEIVLGSKIGEGAGRLTLTCECGHAWTTSRDLDLALFVEER